MGEAVELLMRDINVAEESIKKILDSTTVISENITHLSATGEEVAASSTEGLRMADVTVENMAKCKKVVIYDKIFVVDCIYMHHLHVWLHSIILWCRWITCYTKIDKWRKLWTITII